MKPLLFTYALTYGGAVVSIFRPFYGLLIYFCFAIIRPDSIWYWAIGKGNYSRIIAVALLVGWAIHGFGNWNFGRAKLIVWSLIAYWIWAFFSTLAAASDPSRGWLYLESQGKIVLPFVVGATLIQTTSHIRQIAWVLSISMSYIALEFNQAYYDGKNFLHQSGFGGMDNNCMAIALVTGIGLTLFLGLTAPKWWQKGIAAAGCLLMINAVMFSFSRGGLLALICMGLASFLLVPKRLVHYAGFAAAVAAGYRFAGEGTVNRFLTTFREPETRDASAQSRLDMWGQCWELMVRRPLFGVGPNHFPLYARDEFGWGTLKEAHSLWLQTGAEMGFIGVGMLVAFYLTCIRWLAPLLWSRSLAADDEHRDFARMTIASLIGFLVASQFVSLEGLELPYYVTLVGTGTLIVTSRSDAGPRYTAAPSQRHVFSS